MRPVVGSPRPAGHAAARPDASAPVVAQAFARAGRSVSRRLRGAPSPYPGKLEGLAFAPPLDLFAPAVRGW